MALILIMIRDEPDGTVSVLLQDEPRCTPDQVEFSPAQHIGATALNAIHASLQEVGKTTIDLSAAPSAQPPFKRKLEIVGTDEMPI
ncbi:hypothetical protein EAY64_06425 [Aquitalea palustris]|uniref:Uncharacterized protein n=1 Tax=Aquitalea palustris TaxID=2480983 RepID=A0A454JKS8_9NEIS|nr:hypothetical protein [Aquitalea palustris]RMC99936.1 hypothetical protein EAY64_06425 [Aquitalea palustris]